MSEPRVSAVGTRVALAAALALACADPGPAPTGPPPRLVLIVSDTFRADALDCDDARDRTPHLCELAERGVRFTHAYASAPWTLPATVALFAGRHPTRYARHPLGVGRGDAGRDQFYRIPDDEELLAEALSARGYDAVASVQSSVADVPNTLQGFRRLPIEPARQRHQLVPIVPEVERMRSARYGHYLNALSWVASTGAERFFLLLWIQDPHATYDPPPPFPVSASDGLPRDAAWYRGLGHQDRPSEGMRLLRSEAAALTPDERAHVVALYHAEVASVDERVGLLLDVLERRGWRDDTLVVFTSDHGEGFGEHGLYLHGNSFFEELVRIPLLVAGPGIASGRIEPSPVSHVDLMPTLCAWMEAGCLADAQGRSFRSLLEGRAESAPPRSVYLVSPLRIAHGDALVEGRWKLLTGAERDTLYDLESDPGERRDVSVLHPEVVASLRARIDAIRAADEVARVQHLDASDETVLEALGNETAEQLRALGYVDE